MPVALFTGLPGSGKTAYMVSEILKLREKEPDRTIYALGIDGLIDGLVETLTLEQLHRWWELPTGSIVMIDECQEEHLMPKDNGNVPRWIREMSKVRHYGIDFYLTSQRPAFVSSYVRGLVDRHVHFFRKFNTHVVQRYTWGSCSENPRSRTEQKFAIHDVVALPSKVFSLYKSANAHNMKRKLPRQVYMLAIFAVVAVACLIAVPFRLKAMHDLGTKGADSSSPASARSSASPNAVDPKGQDDRLRQSDYSKWQTPRVAGIPWTAPMFDNLTVQAQPRLYCIAVDDGRCSCQTEQGTKFEVEIKVCRQVASGGLYNPFQPPEKDSSRNARKDDPQVDARRRVGDEMASVDGGKSYAAGVGQQVYVPPELTRESQSSYTMH